MNKDNIEQYWPLLEAVRAGKQIQFLSGSVWKDDDVPQFDLQPASSFRIKPEPIEWWIAYRPFRPVPGLLDRIFVAADNKDDPYWKYNGFTVRKFVEVME